MSLKSTAVFSNFNAAYTNSMSQLTIQPGTELDLDGFNRGIAALKLALSLSLGHLEGEKKRGFNQGLDLLFTPVNTLEKAHNLFSQVARFIPATEESVASAARRIESNHEYYRFLIAQALMNTCEETNFHRSRELNPVRSFITGALVTFGRSLQDATNEPSQKIQLANALLNIEHPTYECDDNDAFLYFFSSMEVFARYGRSQFHPERNGATNGLEDLKNFFASRVRRTAAISHRFQATRTEVSNSAVTSTEPVTVVAVREMVSQNPHFDEEGFLLERKIVDGEVKFCRTVYRRIGILGKGGTGEVIEAYDTSNERYVAIKISKYPLEAAALMAGNFEFERRITASLNSNDVPELLTEGVSPAGHPFTVFKKLAGQPLEEKLSVMSVHEKYDAIGFILDAVERIHDVGVAHRDIKPENIFITETGCIVIDFGLAYNIINGVGLEYETGQFYGTPQYLSPESWMGGQAHNLFKQDVYALGVLIFECLTGRFPYQTRLEGPDIANDWMTALNKAHSSPDMFAPSLYVDGLHPSIDDVVIKALARNPEERFKNAGELKAAWHKAMSRGFHSSVSQPSGWMQKLRILWAGLMKKNPRIASFIGSR